MGDSRGCRGGLRRGLRRCRAAPPLPLVVLPPDGVSTLSVCARVGHHARRLYRLFAFSVPAAPACAVGVVAGAKKPARPRPGVAAPPLWPRPAGSPGQASAGAPYDRLPPSHFLVSVAVGCSGRTPPPPPRRPVSPVAIKVEWGGLRQRSRAPSGRAGALQPRPPVLAPGRGYFVFAAAGLGIAPPAGGAKGLPGCTRCAM